MTAERRLGVRSHAEVLLNASKHMITSVDRKNAELKRALALLGPLEGRLMRLIWNHRVREPFTVRDVLTLTPGLAYTTIMTTLNRLASKGLLDVARMASNQAHEYRAKGSVDEFLVESGREEVERLVDRYGEAALAAFADHLDSLSPSTREALERLRSK